MSKAIVLIFMFIVISMVLFLGISMMSEVPEPDVGTNEYDQFISLGNIIQISYNGFWAILLIMVATVIVISVVSFRGKI